MAPKGALVKKASPFTFNIVIGAGA